MDLASTVQLSRAQTPDFGTIPWRSTLPGTSRALMPRTSSSATPASMALPPFESLPPHRSRSRKAGDRPRRAAVTRTEGREAARGGTRMIDRRRSISTDISMPCVASGPRHAPRDSVLYLGGSIRRLQRRWQVPSVPLSAAQDVSVMDRHDHVGFTCLVVLSLAGSPAFAGDQPAVSRTLRCRRHGLRIVRRPSSSPRSGRTP